MISKDSFTSKQLEAIRHIRNSLIHTGRTPSVRELMESMCYKSPKSAFDLLEQLQEKGIIHKQGNGDYQLITTPDFGPSRAQTVNIPIVGVVACGSPIFAEQNIEGYVPISTSIAKTGSKYYLLHAKGDSMDEAGINDGDLVLVRQQSVARDGDNVVALIDDEATIKEFHKSNSVIMLKPRSSNPIHKPIILEENFQIQGIIVKVIPNFN